MSNLKLTWIVVCVLAIVCLCFAALASGLVPGFPDDHQKNVTVYYPPHADTQGVSAYLQPPVATLQVQGEDQLLAVQYSSHLKTPAVVEQPQLYPGSPSCFTLSSPSAAPQTILPGQSLVLLLHLKPNSGEGACVGQHAIVLHYGWKPTEEPVPAPPKVDKKDRKMMKTAPAVEPPAPAPVAQESAIATSSIQIVTSFRRSAERFFHIAALVCGAALIPILLALVSYNYQIGQARRDENQKTAALAADKRQKEEALKFEVWKIIFPRLTEAIEKYYVDLSRHMDLLRVETKKPVAQVGFDGLFASLFTLRRKYEVFLDDKGGYSFRTKPAEVLCATLTNQFWDECYAFSGNKDKFQATVALFEPKATLNQAKVKLAELKKNDLAVVALLAAFEKNLGVDNHLKEFDRHLEMIVGIIDFECDRPYYPEWYEVPPKIDLTSFNTNHLGVAKGSGDEQSLQAKIDHYKQDVPAKCRA